MFSLSNVLCAIINSFTDYKEEYKELPYYKIKAGFYDKVINIRPYVWMFVKYGYYDHLLFYIRNFFDDRDITSVTIVKILGVQQWSFIALMEEKGLFIDWITVCETASKWLNMREALTCLRYSIFRLDKKWPIYEESIKAFRDLEGYSLYEKLRRLFSNNMSEPVTHILEDVYYNEPSPRRE